MQSGFHPLTIGALILLGTPKLLVEGVAGSGKTLLAVQRALDSASQGLEADAVVVIDLPGRDSRAMAFAELYVGFSRAKHLLQLHTRARDTYDWLSSL